MSMLNYALLNVLNYPPTTFLFGPRFLGFSTFPVNAESVSI